MRRLVYRVQPLPQSMLPLVWDFGQLNPKMEELYIRQMVRRYVSIGTLVIFCYPAMFIAHAVRDMVHVFVRLCLTRSDLT